MKVYIVAEIELPDDLNPEERDEVLNEMDYCFEHPQILDHQIIENQYSYR